MATRILHGFLHRTYGKLFLAASLLMVACGGGRVNPVAPTPGAPIDPSGNWTMTAKDAGGKSVQYAALFSQTGSVVTSNSFTAAGNPPPFACVPFSASLSNGQVLNVSNFTGDVIIGNNFGTFNFNATLAADGKSFAGTYSNMPTCSGLLISGTYTGAEVPTTSGSWTGTIQPCAYSQQTADCPLFGTAGQITATLSQNDATGNVTGSYQITGLADFSSGTVSVVPPSDILSGTVWQFTMQDANGTTFVTYGALDLQGGFIGHTFARTAAGQAYLLTMKH